MNGAIFYATKYGSTAEYAGWIADETGLPAFDVKNANARPEDFDFLVLGSAVIYYKLILRKWLARHQNAILSRPTVLFSVSGAGASGRLDDWIGKSVPPGLVSHLEHFALKGRQRPEDLTFFDGTMLKIAGWMNRHSKVGQEEMHGFDYVDRASIAPVVDRIRALSGTDDA